MSKTISRQRQAIVEHLLISVSSDGVVLDEDWQRLMTMLKTPQITHYFSASFGNPEVTSVQRKQAAEIFKIRGIKTAVVTDEVFVRGLVTAVSWLGANVQAFSWSDTSAAFKYLAVGPALEPRALSELGRLRFEVESAQRKLVAERP